MNKKIISALVLSGLLLVCLLVVHFTFNIVLAKEETAVASEASSNVSNIAAQPENPSGSNIGSYNCRYGTAGFTSQQLAWLPTLKTGWHVTFYATTPYTGEGEHVGIIRVSQDRNGSVYLPTYTTTPALTNAELGAVVSASPGKLWLVGNEPDVADVQDDTYPSMYARIYHDVYEFIKQRDPSAQVGVAGLSMATPGRLQYLDIVWDTYLSLYGTPMPVDVWNIHVYILSEYNPTGTQGDGKLALGTDPALAKNSPYLPLPYSQQCPLDNVYCRAEHDDVDIFIEQMVAMRQWMKDHGQRDKPLILSEFGLLYPYVEENGGCFLSDEFGNCFTPTRVNNYLYDTMQWLEAASSLDLGYPADDHRLVQQWLWFSLYVDAEVSGGSSNLLKDNYLSFVGGDINGMSEVGMFYQQQIASYELYANLFAVEAMPTVENIQAPASTVDAEISVEFFNNGNQAITDPFTVSFYKDANLTQLIDSVTINPTVNGCARLGYVASVTWPSLSSGTHHFWVKLDSANVISEDVESDNVVSGVVLVDPEDIYLPFTRR